MAELRRGTEIDERAEPGGGARQEGGAVGENGREALVKARLLTPGGGGDRDAEFFEFAAGQPLLFSAGETPDDLAQLTNASGFLAEGDERHALPEMRGSQFEALGIVGQHAVELVDSLLIVLLKIGDFAEIKLGIGGEVGIAVILQVVLEFLASEVVFAAGDIAEAVGIEGVGGRGGASRRSGAS